MQIEKEQLDNTIIFYKTFLGGPKKPKRYVGSDLSEQNATESLPYGSESNTTPDSVVDLDQSTASDGPESESGYTTEETAPGSNSDKTSTTPKIYIDNPEDDF